MKETTKQLAERLNEIRLRHNANAARWRKAHPERYREVYINYFRRKKGYYLVSEIGRKGHMSLIKAAKNFEEAKRK